MTDFYIKQGDTDPDITATLEDQNGTAFDLTDCTVKFHMKKGTTIKVNAEATILDVGTDDVSVRYSWQNGDTDTSLNYSIEWEITKSDGQIETVPNSSHDTVRITPELA